MPELGEGVQTPDNRKEKSKGSGVLSDSDIIVKIQQKSKEAVGWYDSRISKERMRVMEYYNALLPRRQHEGSSSYVSTDVYDSVEMMKAQLLEVFAGGDEIAQFDPDQDMGVEDCREATEACRYVIFRENPGFKIFNDIIHDGLTARVGVAKVYWEERFDHVEEEFHDLPYADAHALAAQEHVEEFEAELNPDTQMFDGHLLKKIDRSGVRIEVVAPEEFLIEPRAVTIDRAAYKGHRSLKTKAELKNMGLDPKKVDEVHYDDARGLDLSPEVLARNQPVETLQALNNPIQPEMEQVMLYESYVKMQIEKRKGVRLYKILHTDAVLFEYQEVDRAPFVVYVPLPVPHLFFGNNFAQRVIPIQNARTILTRSILDHASMTTNPRWQVVKGGLVNPREMIDNRMGGLVNVSRPDSVMALQVPNLNPFVFELQQALQADKEQNTGISSLSQGLNKDAISKQNSAGLVDNLVQLSNQRQKIAARNFAYGFFTELMVEVMRLLVLNENKQKLIEVAGQWKQVDPEKWEERTTCSVSMHLGYGEKDQHLAKLEKFYQGLAQDPGLGGMFTQQNRYNMIIDSGKVAGIMKIGSYITPPSPQTQPQPDPIKMGEVKAKTTSAQAQLITAQSQADRNKNLDQIDKAKIQQQSTKNVMQAMDHTREHARMDFETKAKVDDQRKQTAVDVADMLAKIQELKSQIDVAQRQMALEERMAPEELAIQKEKASRPAGGANG